MDPVPVSTMVKLGVLVSLDAMVRVVVRDPFAEAVKTTLKEEEPPAEISEFRLVVVILKSELFVPELLMMGLPDRVRLPVPVLEIWILSAVLAEWILRVPKS